jgi:uncharacterized membrane protein YcaP (DUF421 family)
MWNEIREGLDTVFGTVETDLNAFQMTMRAVVTFIVTVAVIRLGNKRLFGKGTAFDTVVAIMIGSVMSRAITGSGSGTMLATWAGGLTLIMLHWLLATLSHHLAWFGPVVKGNAVTLVEHGEIVHSGMERTGSTENDLERALRSNGNTPDISNIETAVMERDGSISVIPKSSGPRIIDVSVKDGVQTVRLALE